ncbi:MAG: c-type cytochrome [Calditrichae bacterium]|nr:c-type cytochrome [Calditrichia bacterium]
MAKQKVKDELLNHDYDGIQELDNDLPPWWLYLFYFTIIFGVVYMLHYHVLGTGDLQVEAYEKEMKAAEAQALARAQGQQSAAPLVQLTDEGDLAAGKEVYMVNCVPCHGQLGEGGVGPNMTDEYWIHGGEIADLVHTINVGVPEKGMISWAPILSKKQMQQVASYILTLQGTNPPNAKEPQGKKGGRINTIIDHGTRSDRSRPITTTPCHFWHVSLRKASWSEHGKFPSH